MTADLNPEKINDILHRMHMIICPGDYGMGDEPESHSDDPKKAWEELSKQWEELVKELKPLLDPYLEAGGF